MTLATLNPCRSLTDEERQEAIAGYEYLHATATTDALRVYWLHRKQDMVDKLSTAIRERLAAAGAA